MKSINTITKDTTIGDVVRIYPESAKLLVKKGMHCVGCHVATWETLEQGCQSHGIDVDEVVNELNKSMEKQRG